VSLFQYQVGAAGPGIAAASDADTNIPSPGQLPAMHEFLVYSVQMVPDEITEVAFGAGAQGIVGAFTDLPEQLVTRAMHKWKTIYANLLFQFRIEQSKNFVEGRIDHFPAGGGPHFEHTEATGLNPSLGVQPVISISYTTAYIHTNGTQSWEATRRLASPIYLAGLETFRGVLRFPRGAFAAGTTNNYLLWAQGFGMTCRLTGPRRRPTL
jgi:hypothetical protein